VVGKHSAFLGRASVEYFRRVAHLRSALRFRHRSYPRVTGLAKPL
jgi:hypothetical protein